MTSQEAFDSVETIRVGLHEVESGSAVGMYVHQARHEHAVSEVTDSAFGRQFGISVAPELNDVSILEKEQWPIDPFEGRVERFGSKCKHLADGPYSIATLISSSWQS
jgi:hypothetical protein